MQKEKADQTASPQNTHANYSTHIAELELLLVEQMHFIGQAWPFAKLIERMKAEGFDRAEVVEAVNKLEDQGVLKYRRHTHGVLQGSCRVSRVFKLLFSLPAAPSLG